MDSTKPLRLPRKNHYFGQIHHACPRFCNPHELLRLPRIYAPRPSVFHDFDFQIALAPQHGANFVGIFAVYGS